MGKLATLLLLLAVAAWAEGKAAHAGDKYHKEPAQPRTRRELGSSRRTPEDDAKENITFWMEQGTTAILESLNDQAKFNFNHAKNILLFIGDGMSIPTISASRIYKAQRYDDNFVNPESSMLTFESFPNVGLSKPYDTDKQVGDSASTASAMYSGVKTKYFTVGYDSSIDHDDVTTMDSATKVETVLDWAQAAGMDTGFVTTARVTHATPAALYAHTFDRFWEGDCADQKPSGTIPEYAHDIAYQMIRTAPGNRTKVMLGGGYPSFYGRGQCPEQDEIEYPDEEDIDCYRDDELNLVDEWLVEHGDRAQYVKTADELMKVKAADTDYLLGLVGSGYVAFSDQRTNGIDPTLSQMTEKALEILKKNTNGFFLMVEGGRIDHAHHDNTAIRAVEETAQLDFAVEKALEMLEDELDQTLIIVTADHAHMMSFSGYNFRGNDITELNDDQIDDDLPYLTLNYGNGPGFANNFEVVEGEVRRVNLSEVDYQNPAWTQASWGYDNSAKHGGDDVAIYARGPMAHLFHKLHEQTHIAYVMAYSACIGPYANDARCQSSKTDSGSTLHLNMLSVVFLLVSVLLFR